MKGKNQILIFALICFSLVAQAQTYDIAAGMRLGTEWGLTGQFRIGNKTTIEGILQSSFGKDEGIATVLIEQHQPILFKRLNLYGGAGLHRGWNGSKSENKAPFGVSLVGGMEVTFARLNISYDFKPAFNLRGGDKKVYIQTGISVRYVLVPRKTKWLNWGKKKKKRKKNKKKKSFNWKFWEKQ